MGLAKSDSRESCKANRAKAHCQLSQLPIQCPASFVPINDVPSVGEQLFNWTLKLIGSTRSRYCVYGKWGELSEFAIQAPVKTAGGPHTLHDPLMRTEVLLPQSFGRISPRTGGFALEINIHHNSVA